MTILHRATNTRCVEAALLDGGLRRVKPQLSIPEGMNVAAATIRNGRSYTPET